MVRRVSMSFSLFSVVLLGVPSAGCQSGYASGSPFNGGASAGAEDAGDGDDADGDDGGDGADGGDGGDGATGDTDGSADDSADDGGGAGAGLPCDVLEVVAADCWTCHGPEPMFGAPMPLASYDDFVVPTPTDPATSVADQTVLRLHDPVSIMPPEGELSPQKMGVLEGWIDAGMPRYDSNDCEDPGDGGGGQDVDDLPCTPSHTFVGHAQGSDDAFHVPVVDDLYMCYTFKSPFAAGTQVTAYAPIVDDERVLHHWIMYKTGTAQPDGGAGPCNMPWDAQFVAGWAPGGDNAVLPDHVGLETAGPDEYLILQVHYNNVAGYQDAMDQSGVAFCTTEQPRPNLAGVLWLGSVLISVPPGSTDYPVDGTCNTGDWTEPFHVMSTSPHMHQLGRGFRTEIVRAGGGVETLTDEPNFSFENQKDYPNDPEVLINPGDTLNSTCLFDNPSGQTVYFGEGTADEMCFNFVTGYPIDKIPERMCGILF